MGEQGRFCFDAASERRFAVYHAENPAVYAALRRFALEAKRAGRHRLGINALVERVRWYTAVEAVGDSFKINNSFAPHYARLLMATEPELAGFFETRKSRADDEVAA